MLPQNQKNIVVSFLMDCVHCKPLSTTESYMQPGLKGDLKLATKVLELDSMYVFVIFTTY